MLNKASSFFPVVYSYFVTLLNPACQYGISPKARCCPGRCGEEKDRVICLITDFSYFIYLTDNFMWSKTKHRERTLSNLVTSKSFNQKQFCFLFLPLNKPKFNQAGLNSKSYILRFWKVISIPC